MVQWLFFYDSFIHSINIALITSAQFILSKDILLTKIASIISKLLYVQ